MTCFRIAFKTRVSLKRICIIQTMLYIIPYSCLFSNAKPNPYYNLIWYLWKKDTKGNWCDLMKANKGTWRSTIDPIILSLTHILWPERQFSLKMPRANLTIHLYYPISGKKREILWKNREWCIEWPLHSLNYVGISQLSLPQLSQSLNFKWFTYY